MPFVRVKIPAATSSAHVHAISDTVYQALVTIANVPVHDKFQVVFQVLTRHAADELIHPRKASWA